MRLAAEDFEEGASLTALDVSDLEDAEPKTLDALFAFYDKVRREGIREEAKTRHFKRFAPQEKVAL